MPKPTIPLCSPFKPNKVKWPALVSEKIDGVPIKFSYRQGSSEPIYWSLSRQGEEFGSYKWILHEFCDWVFKYCPAITAFDMVGELDHETVKNFKDVSGIVRREEPNKGLRWNVFDGWAQNRYSSFVSEQQPFSRRFMGIDGWIGRNAPFNTLSDGLRDVVRVVRQERVDNQEDLDRFVRSLDPASEGAVLRNKDELWEPGRRMPGYMRITNDPTIDLMVVGITEAHDKYGDPKSMVGGLVVSYKGSFSKVGPGTMLHRDRRALFADTVRNEASNESIGLPGSPNEVWYSFPDHMIAEIKYKKDDSYDALRQPTFQCWRPDKLEPDA